MIAVYVCFVILFGVEALRRAARFAEINHPDPKIKSQQKTGHALMSVLSLLACIGAAITIGKNL